MTRLNDLIERLRSWLPMIPLLLLLAGTYWLNQQVRPLVPKADSSKRHDVDYSVEHLSSVTLDEHGKARYLMTTEKMWHYPDDDTTYIDHPHFINLNANASPLIISSRTGKVSSHGDEVFLYDNVRIIRLAEDERNKLTFSTDYLHFITGSDQADTDRPVTIVTQSDTMDGIGMTLDNKLQTAHLLSNVRASHVPLLK
jgi:lipopolysaccharide export system protein LptC